MNKPPEAVHSPNHFTGGNASSDRMKYFVLVGLFAGLMICMYGTISYHNLEYSQWDLHDYRAIAQASPGLADGVRQPFVYRILGPYIAGVLPFSVDVSFRVLSVSLALMLALLLYLFLNASGIEPSVSALTTLFFLLNKYLFGFPVWNYFQIGDILSQIEILVLTWAMISRKWLVFGIVLFFGSLTKETPFLMIPTAFVYLADTGRFEKKWGRFLGAVLPACCAAIVIRLVLHPAAGNSLPQALSTYADKLLLPETWFRLLINSFIPLTLLPIIFFASTKNYFESRRYAFVYLMLVLLSTFFGYNNERLMAPAFIIFYPLIAVIIQDRISRSKPMVLTMIGTAILASIHHEYARSPVPRNITVAISLSAFGIVTLSALYYRLRMARHPHFPVQR